MLGVEIILRGMVQGVNCRRAVQLIASEIGVTGTIENLKDPMKVRIYCEAENEKQLDLFASKLKGMELPIMVEEVKITSTPLSSRKYEFFEIIRGEPWYEMGERFEIAGHEMHEMTKLSLKQLEKQDQTIQAIDGMHSDLNSMHSDITERFDRMDSKYGKLSQILEELKDALIVLASKK